MALAELKEQWAELPEPATPEQRRRFAQTLATWMESQGASLITRVADYQGLLVGMAWLVVFDRVPNIDQPVRKTGDIQSVFVVPAFRRTGIAYALVSSLLEVADAEGIDRVTVSANEAAVSLYASAGFRINEFLLERRRPDRIDL